MIKETDGDSFEELRSLNQELTFKYADNMFKNANINFGNIQNIIGEDNLYTNLGLLLSDQCLHTLKIAVFEGKEIGAFLVVLPNVHFAVEEKINEKEQLKLPEEYEEILAFLETGTKSRREIQEYIKVSQTKIITILKKLQKLNLIEKIGKGKNTEYDIIKKDFC